MVKDILVGIVIVLLLIIGFNMAKSEAVNDYINKCELMSSGGQYWRECPA